MFRLKYDGDARLDALRIASWPHASHFAELDGCEVAVKIRKMGIGTIC